MANLRQQAGQLVSHMDEASDTILDFVICAVVIPALLAPLTMAGYLLWRVVHKSAPPPESQSKAGEIVLLVHKDT
jgi:hypothetical protein